MGLRVNGCSSSFLMYSSPSNPMVLQLSVHSCDSRRIHLRLLPFRILPRNRLIFLFFLLTRSLTSLPRFCWWSKTDNCRLVCPSQIISKSIAKPKTVWIASRVRSTSCKPLFLDHLAPLYNELSSPSLKTPFHSKKRKEKKKVLGEEDGRHLPMQKSRKRTSSICSTSI